jgi:hypothetical protein
VRVGERAKHPGFCRTDIPVCRFLRGDLVLLTAARARRMPVPERGGPDYGAISARPGSNVSQRGIESSQGVGPLFSALAARTYFRSALTHQRFGGLRPVAACATKWQSRKRRQATADQSAGRSAHSNRKFCLRTCSIGTISCARLRCLQT